MTAYFASLKARLTVWYNENVVARWYASQALIGGWIVSAIAFLPDLLQWAVVDNFELFAGIALPTLDPLYKAALLGFYVTFIAPPLRARIQKKMQAAALVQAAKSGAVSSAKDTASILIAVPGVAPAVVRPGELG